MEIHVVNPNKTIVGFELISASAQTIINIDSQHGSYLKPMATCRLVWFGEHGVTDKNVGLALIERPDPDALLAALIIEARAEGKEISHWREKVELIAGFDEFSVLPETNMPAYREFCALSAAISDFKVNFDQRVQLMRDYMETGADVIPNPYFEGVDEAQAAIDLLHTEGKIQVRGELVIVRDAPAIRGILVPLYRYGKVLVVEFPVFPSRTGPFRKFTVARHPSIVLDMRRIWDPLQELEKDQNPDLKQGSWGGSDSIGGSTNGESTVLTIQAVVNQVELAIKQPTARGLMRWLDEKGFGVVSSNPWLEYCQEVGQQPANDNLSASEQRVVALLERAYKGAPPEVPASHVLWTLVSAHRSPVLS
jgi:hypothetical protein